MKLKVAKDFAFEHAPGLPEALPEGETILWQGRPRVLPLARQAFWLDWVIGYFVLVTIWRVMASGADHPWSEAVLHGVPLVLLGILASLVILFIAWLQARGTIYTLTTHRAALRIGAALQITLNLPYQWIENASLETRKDGTGTIALELKGEENKVSFLMVWPHMRPWRLARPEPALRCIPDAAKVAQILANAAEARVSDAQSITLSPKPDRAPSPKPGPTAGAALPAE
ncbi:MAG: photosynthetic complex putative assembly protein PuhB [Pseudomonadota bacterium]